jgi:hypothetical protein
MLQAMKASEAITVEIPWEPDFIIETPQQSSGGAPRVVPQERF